MKKCVFAFSLLSLLAAAPLSAGQNDKKVDEIFNKLDANKDGKISYEEFMNGWYKAGADQITVKSEELDANKDGKVTWKEMQIHFKKKFDDADVNKDGYLDRKEAFVLFNF